MNLVLQLPPELESKLTAEAAHLGLALPDYALRLLSDGSSAPAAPRNGAELVAYWQSEGLIGTNPEITDAPAHARALREQSQSRVQP